MIVPPDGAFDGLVRRERGVERTATQPATTEQRARVVADRECEAPKMKAMPLRLG